MPQQKCRGNCLGGMQKGTDARSRKTTGSTPVSWIKQDVGAPAETGEIGGNAA